MNNLGMPIIGLGALSPEYADLPLHWMPHIQVADVAASVQRAVDLGGSVLMQANVGDEGGQWAVLLDPNQAAFGIIPVVTPGAIAQQGGAPSFEAATPVGRINWLDVTVPDASATCDFYRRVIGWSGEVVEMHEGDARYVDYKMLGEDGTALAGIRHARGVNAGLPPVWMIYLLVDNLAESLRRVEEEGGNIIQTMRGDDGKHRNAVVQDPVGAYFGLTHA
jgi:predicted enzyme related to lactoylglutathione lyase